ncbi:MAG: hypothetical protein ACLGHN_11450 [Bacteriovoracia bacterium]
MKYLLVSVLLSCSAQSATCKKLNECLEAGEKLTGTKLIYDKKTVPFTYELNAPLEMNKNNAEKVLSEALLVFGLTVVPTDLKNTEKIIDARDLKFQSDLPSYKASKNKIPNLPDTKTPVSVTYEGVKGVDMEIIAKNIEPLLSRYGRVAPMRGGTLVIIDLANVVEEVLPKVVKQDYPLTATEKKQIEIEKKRAHELDMARLKSGEMHEIGPHKHDH